MTPAELRARPDESLPTTPAMITDPHMRGPWHKRRCLRACLRAMRMAPIFDNQRQPYASRCRVCGLELSREQWNALFPSGCRR